MRRELLLCSSFNGSSMLKCFHSCHRGVTAEERECARRLQVCMCVDHLPFGAVLQSVAYLVFGLKQDVLELGGAGPPDRQLVLKVAHATHMHAGRRISGHCTQEERCKTLARSRCAAVRARIRDTKGLDELLREILTHHSLC